MESAKARFLRKDFIPLLKSIPAEAKGQWGKMSPQQMVEHFTDAVRIAAGNVPDITLVTPGDALPKMQAFLLSDKPFRENTRNPLLPETPAPVRHASMSEALHELQAAFDSFFDVFYANEQATTRNPLFGDLNFDMNVQLLYKHAAHHLRQFGVEATLVH